MEQKHILDQIQPESTQADGLLSHALADYCRLLANPSNPETQSLELKLDETQIKTRMSGLLMNDTVRSYLFSFTGSQHEMITIQHIEKQLASYSPQQFDHLATHYQHLTDRLHNLSSPVHEEIEEYTLRFQERCRLFLDGYEGLLAQDPDLSVQQHTYNHLITYLHQLIKAVQHNPELLSERDFNDLDTRHLGKEEAFGSYKKYKKRRISLSHSLFQFSFGEKIQTQIAGIQHDIRRIQSLRHTGPSTETPGGEAYEKILSQTEHLQKWFTQHLAAYVCPTYRDLPITFSNDDRTYIDTKLGSIQRIGVGELFFHGCIVESILCAYLEYTYQELGEDYQIIHTSLIDDLSGVDACMDRHLPDGTLERTFVDFKLNLHTLHTTTEKNTSKKKLYDSLLRLIDTTEHKQIDFDELKQTYPTLHTYPHTMIRSFSKEFSLSLTKALLEHAANDGELFANINDVSSYKQRLYKLFANGSFQRTLNKHLQIIKEQTGTKTAQTVSLQHRNELEVLLAEENIDSYSERVAI